jgi:E3 Ubiquitin ligase
MFPAAIFSSSDERFLIWPLIGAIAGVYWFYKGFRLLQRKRLILNTPASKIRSASMGLVEISGLATGPYVMTSPLKQVECYYYQSTAWELRQRGKNSEWVKVAEENLHVPFYLDDSTDKVLVDPRGADLDLHCDFQEEYNRSILFEGPEMPGCVREFLQRRGVDPGKRIKVEEHCIKPKNFLFVLGTLSQNPGVDASVAPAWAQRAGDQPFRSQSTKATQPEVIRLSEERKRVAVTEMTQQQKIAAALSRAGMSNPAAWNAATVSTTSVSTGAAKTALAVEAQPAAEDAGAFDLHPPVVLMKGSHDPAFFISWRSQRDVIASLGWKSSLMIWGGPALTILCVYMLLAHFGQL